MADKLSLGDVVSFQWQGSGYDTGTVCQVHTDGTVDVFRPFTHTGDFSYTGRNPGSSAVTCYVGVEVVKSMSPASLTLVRKGGTLR
jgi:hypothetical protein